MLQEEMGQGRRADLEPHSLDKAGEGMLVDRACNQILLLLQ